jgi:hypothetical protein
MEKDASGSFQPTQFFLSKKPDSEMESGFFVNKLLEGILPLAINDFLRGD